MSDTDPDDPQPPMLSHVRTEPDRLGGVLFDLPADRLPVFVAGLRRLTSKLLQLCWLPSADDQAGRVLVRVESPPTLVIERESGRAYAEGPADVWVQVGFHLSPTEAIAPPP